MAKWLYTVKGIRDVMTEDEDWQSVQDSMSKIADIIEAHNCFNGFNTIKFRNIPKGDDYFGPIDYADKLIEQLYDYADEKRIWVE